MLIEQVLNIVYTVFSLLLLPIDLPNLPPDMSETIYDVFGYISAGLGFVGEFLDLDYLLVLFGLVLAVDVGLLLYKFIMWFIRKIPFLGIK